MPSAAELLTHIQASISEVTPNDVGGRRLLDVREPEEQSSGTVPGALSIPRGLLESRIESSVPNRSTPIAVYCASGVRSAYATRTLEELGYEDVVSIRGGYAAWAEAGLPTHIPVRWTADQRERYARHFSLPEVGINGQERLLSARVLLVGAGGLGSPTALYLAAAGVGHITIVDGDRVDRSNLQRQIAHAEERIGEWKTASAASAMQAINPDVRVTERRERIGTENVIDLVRDADVVVDGVDNLATRYLLNDACVRLGVPLVSASVLGFDGQLTVFYRPGPCYRCLYPDPPPPELTPSCAAAGVLGAVPGIIGMAETIETLKLLLGLGEPMIGRLQLYDALDASWTTLRTHRNPDCPTCASPASIDAPFEDYVDLCGG